MSGYQETSATSLLTRATDTRGESEFRAGGSYAAE